MKYLLLGLERPNRGAKAEKMTSILSKTKQVKEVLWISNKC